MSGSTCESRLGCGGGGTPLAPPLELLPELLLEDEPLLLELPLEEELPLLELPPEDEPLPVPAPPEDDPPEDDVPPEPPPELLPEPLLELLPEEDPLLPEEPDPLEDDPPDEDAPDVLAAAEPLPPPQPAQASSDASSTPPRTLDTGLRMLLSPMQAAGNTQRRYAYAGNLDAGTRSIDFASI
ncbi:MAG: hypothetical protein ACRETW_08310 [Stenotrophobium sp.]